MLTMMLLAVAIAGTDPSPVLEISGTHFTLDGEPTFLLGASYYGALGIEDRDTLRADLDDLKAHGFNWIRVWATWNAFDDNLCAVAPDGTPREPYMGRLKRLCRMAGRRGMVVDVTVTRQKTDEFPSNMSEHRAVIKTLADHLKPFRNVYIDVGNERNVGDARHVPMNEVAELIALVKRLDPSRLCTASQGGDIGEEETVAYIDAGKVDFICPHRPRDRNSPGHTAATTKEYFQQMTRASRVVPVHYQEPFRRGYGRYSPSADDFMTDLEAAHSSGAAGWCFHNGSVRGQPDNEDGRPRRSFDMRPEEGRLFDQLDDVERDFMSRVKQKNWGAVPSERSETEL